ncbi:HGxxPAAW family protein [Streptomyces rubellomurinus]|uniref:Membrane protein n=2 Tax=Streptomyces TaxID=1883 RepID=A0A0F2T7J7_STRR3|nr:HGxxPAAW family protein [Streptomyces rubellomurinus]KJS54945.1 membrane protein [Streptomyces rubellomurinus subsp. indigoferus]KJS59194.1 membrane protein [Streptomyces rubellomurinus]
MSAAAHGHTPAAWTGVVIAFIGFGVAGVAMILPSPLLVWAGMAVVLVGGIVGKAMAMAGMGKQPSPHVYKSVEEQTKAREAAIAAA